jgi:histidyl-tRNA synthetase
VFEGDRLIFKVLNSGDYLSKASLDDNTTSKSLTKQISEKALRYDLTVPFARFVMQNRNEITFPFKRYQMQNVWRADKPQKGRYREFFQCDADVIGTSSLLCEVELVQLYDDVFSQLKIPNVDICINNRKVLSGMVELMGVTDLFEDIVITLDKLSAIGLEKVKRELISKGVKSESFSILDTFLNTKNVSDLSSLLEQSETFLVFKKVSKIENDSDFTPFEINSLFTFSNPMALNLSSVITISSNKSVTPISSTIPLNTFRLFIQISTLGILSCEKTSS